MSKPMESVYRQAAAILRKQGWRQHNYGTPDGPVCMDGALSLVLTRGRLTYQERAPVAMTLYDVCGTRICYFNDIHCATVDDAIAALEIAADIEACS